MAASGVWSEHQLAGHSCDIFEPGGQSESQFVVLYLHGARLQRLVDESAFAAEFDRHGLRVIAPRSGRSWWTDKVCSEFDPQLSTHRYLLEQVVPYIAQRWEVRPPAIGLLGTGMGGQGALRLAFKQPRLFPVVAALSPAIDYYQQWNDPDSAMLWEMYSDAEAARQDTATLHVHPLNWPRNTWFACDPLNPCWFNSADKLRMKMAAIGIPYECDLETSIGAGGLAYYRQMIAKAVDYLVDRLLAESRRV
jgi:pimeloyl-ACP methyl ester carboxylesterase